jgi:hypothetical protein
MAERRLIPRLNFRPWRRGLTARGWGVPSLPATPAGVVAAGSLMLRTCELEAERKLNELKHVVTLMRDDAVQERKP